MRRDLRQSRRILFSRPQWSAENFELMRPAKMGDLRYPGHKGEEAFCYAPSAAKSQRG
jgi:hypothetical protein